MEDFNIASHLRSAYAAFPEAKPRPVIGITANYGDGTGKIIDQYYLQVIRAGGIPVLLPSVADAQVIINTLDRIDAVVNPARLGEAEAGRRAREEDKITVRTKSDGLGRLDELGAGASRPVRQMERTRCGGR